MRRHLTEDAVLGALILGFGVAMACVILSAAIIAALYLAAIL